MLNAMGTLLKNNYISFVFLVSVNTVLKIPAICLSRSVHIYLSIYLSCYLAICLCLVLSVYLSDRNNHDNILLILCYFFYVYIDYLYL